VEIEREGCCSAQLAAHFAEQPAGTMENSEEGGSLFGEGESRRGAARGHQPWRKWSSCWFPWESRAQGTAGCFGVLGKRETRKGVFLAGQGKTGARERRAGRRDCWPEMEFGLQQRGVGHGEEGEGRSRAREGEEAEEGAMDQSSPTPWTAEGNAGELDQ
jgi:hypothetical protein